MSKDEQTIKLEIVATGHKVSSDDSLLILLDPQWYNMIDYIRAALERVTGHDRHEVIPIPKDQIKIFSVQHPIIVSRETPQVLILPKSEL